jgi:acetate kinase
VRRESLRNLEWAGIKLDPIRNEEVTAASGEQCVSAPDSRTQVWVVPTNEELVVARQTAAAVS